MTAQITVKMDNAAFENAAATELARILRHLAEQVEAGELAPINLRDSNGNRVGEFVVEE